MSPSRADRAGCLINPSNALNWTGILCHQTIRRQQRCSFSVGLREQHAIEGIPVDRGQQIQGQRVLSSNGQFLIAVVQQAGAQPPGFNPEVRSTKPPLDGHFPKTGGLNIKSMTGLSKSVRVALGGRFGSLAAQSSTCVSSK